MKATVIIRKCTTYNIDTIESIISQGLDSLSLRPTGRTLIKPNVVASGDKFPHAYTRPEFIEGVIRAVQSKAENIEEIAVGERCGITVPTRYAYKNAGYYKVFKRTKVDHYHFEEETQVKIPLTHKGRLRDFIFVPEAVARADFFINCPKFKAHPWTTVTFSMKNYIGIQDDRHRLIDHDHKLNQKVADLQYVLQPQFIAIDAITAGEGRMLTPIPFDMGLIIMGNNQVAFDALCCHIIGLDPLSVEHIRLAYERGFGPVSLDKIEVIGDLTLEEAQKRAEGFRVGLIRVEEYFQGTNIDAYAGPPPDSDADDYCWGGCPGAMEEAIEIMRMFDDKTDEKTPRTHIVFGNYKGKIDAKDDEKVIFIGDCTSFHGTIKGKNVSFESAYLDRSSKSPYDAENPDIFRKMISVEKLWFQKRNDNVMRILGCPVSVAEQVLLLVKLGKLKNPYFDTSEVMTFSNCYFSSKTKMAIERLTGKPYLRDDVERGDAKTLLNDDENADGSL